MPKDGLGIEVDLPWKMEPREQTPGHPDWRWGNKCYVYPGEAPPRGYGVAMVDWSMDRTIAYPLGINWIMALADRVVLWLRRPPVERAYAVACARREVEGYQKGRETGHHEGRMAGFDVGYAKGLMDGEKRYIAAVMADLDAKREAARARG